MLFIFHKNIIIEKIKKKRNKKYPNSNNSPNMGQTYSTTTQSKEEVEWSFLAKKSAQ